MEFVNGVNESSCSHVDVLFDGCVDDFLGSIGHDFLQTCINDVDLSCALQHLDLFEFLSWQISGFLDDIQKVLLCFLFPFSVHSSWSDMFQILQPFEIADSNTTCITQNIRQELNTLVSQDLFTFHCGWSIGSLNDKFGLELVSIVLVDGLLQSSWNEEVNWFVNGRVIKVGLTSWVSLDCFVFVSFFIFE